MGPRRSSYDFEDSHEDLHKAGTALKAGLKKDALLRTLKSAGESLAEAAQSSEAAKLASRELAKALGRPDLLQHKDKEVRLYVALCVVHILRLNAPDTPYTDDQLQAMFELLNGVYAELEDPAAPHFQLCLSIVETVSQVKCSLLILDLPGAEELVCSLCATLLDAINEENVGVLEGTALELLRAVVEEADDLPAAQLDVILSRLLPAAAAENPAAARLARDLLRRTETVVQPHLQKLLSTLLVSPARSDSELKDETHSLFYALHEAVPQTLLPLLPLLRDELEVDATKQRAAAVDLVARLLTGHPGGGALVDEYEPLLSSLLQRACDKEAEVRRKVLGYLPALLEAVQASPQRLAEVVKTGVARLADIDESVRRAALGAVGGLLQAHPQLAGAKHTEGRGTVVSCLVNRLRDKKLGVRREAASQCAALVRAWLLAHDERGAAAAPRLDIVLGIPLVLCNMAVRDSELGAHILDGVLRGGLLPPRLAPAAAARYWALMWKGAGDDNRAMLLKIIQGKASVQARVQELLQLRAAAKEQRAAGAGGATSSAGAGAASGSLPGGSLLSTGGGLAGVDAERRLQERLHSLAAVLRDVSKPEEGLQRLLEQRDNHIFRGLAALAAYGCSLKDAQAAGKDVMQRVGSKGPAADLTRALVARLTPSLLPPEVLHGAMEAAEGSQEAQRLLVDMAAAAPHLLAQSLGRVSELFEADDPLLAECGARALAGAGRHMLAHCRATKQAVPTELTDRLAELCDDASPGCVKAAVRALVVLSGPERAEAAAADLADRLMKRLKSKAARASHRALLAPLKGLSQLGRLLPGAFEAVADELLDCCLNDLLPADLSRGKPLAEADPARTGREWRSPSPSTAVKTAVLRTLCQALVPDSSRPPTEAQVDRARQVWETLEPLTDTDPQAEQFQPFAFVFPRSEGASQRAKRRRVEGGASDDDDEEDEELECTDAAWVRYSAVSGLLRLARGYDTAMPASLYASLAVALQEPLPEPRAAMTSKLAKAVERLAGGKSGSTAAKYAACLALFAADPEPRNRAFALRTLRDFTAQRRRAVAVLAARAAAARGGGAEGGAGGGGATLLHEMPDFLLAFLVFLLAHHPDYPTQEVLDEYEAAYAEEREEGWGPGGPYAPFLAMMQFALEALLVPPEGAAGVPAELPRLLPAPLKLLRTLKFCEDASPQPRTQEAHQLCDMGLLLAKAIADRLRGGKGAADAEPARFPGQVVLPRMCFRPNLGDRTAKLLDGSDLPPPAYLRPGLADNELFMRSLMPGLPGPAGPAKQRQRAAKGASKAKSAAKAAAEEEEEEEEMLDADEEEEESVGATPAPGTHGADSDGEVAGEAGGSADRPRKGGKARVAPAASPGSGPESSGGAAEQAAVLAPKTKRPAAAAKNHGSGGGGGARSKPAATPSRQQPRRGAKTDASGKLRADSSAEEEEEEEEMEDSQPQQQQQRGGGWTAAAAAAGPAAGLRAGTDDEETDAGDSQPPPAKQQPRGKRQQQQQQEDAVSPGQENHAAANGAAARGGGGKGKKGAAAAKPAAKSKAPAGGAKAALKRARV